MLLTNKHALARNHAALPYSNAIKLFLDRLVIRAEDARSEGVNSVFSAVDSSDESSPTSASPSSSFATATVVVAVQDVNDNSPRFPDAPYSCRVRENEQELTAPVFVAAAVDRDDPPYDRVEYSLR